MCDEGTILLYEAGDKHFESVRPVPIRGMSLRQYYVGQILQGMARDMHIDSGEWQIEQMALIACRVADTTIAMEKKTRRNGNEQA